MPERDLRMRQSQAITLETERTKGRRGKGKRMSGGTHVMAEAGKGEFFGARPTAVLVGCFEDQDPPTCFGECDGRHKPVGT
jgi:hypothetical protein